MLKKVMSWLVLFPAISAVVPEVALTYPVGSEKAVEIYSGIRSGESNVEELDRFYTTLNEQEFIDLQVDLLVISGTVSVEETPEIQEHLWMMSMLSWETYRMSLNHLNGALRSELANHPLVHERTSTAGVPSPILTGCSYTGATAYDPPMTQQANYSFQGHVAIYFRVDGNANCYRKFCSQPTWGGDCGDGKIPYWHLLCKDQGCSWYSWNGKYVKDVVMLVPKSWWYFYWMYPSATKASWFSLFWGPTNSPGCCDPGCMK